MKESISTRSVALLPDIDRLREICQSIAILDAIIKQEWEYRYYSFNSKWDIDEQMASMRDGHGDSYFILFTPNGTIIKGFGHKSPMGRYTSEHNHPWPGILDSIPQEFNTFLTEPAFSMDETSFCIWRKYSDNSWNIGNINFPRKEVENINFPKNDDPDGSTELLYILNGDPKTYWEWSEWYYDRKIDFGIVESIYQHEPLSIHLIEKLNPDLNLYDLQNDISEIGYPSLIKDISP